MELFKNNKRAIEDINLNTSEASFCPDSLGSQQFNESQTSSKGGVGQLESQNEKLEHEIRRLDASRRKV